MTAILCYGDSNTWGFEASTQERLGRWDRWPGVLQRELGDDVHVIEEGQNGRTTVFDVPFEPNRNGLTYLPVALQTILRSTPWSSISGRTTCSCPG